MATSALPGQDLIDRGLRDVRVYLVGGATAVLLGWRPTTIDVDLVMRPEDDTLLRAIAGLKESLPALRG